MENIVCLRPLKCDDLEEIVCIHMNAFDGFFLTSLGKSFLKTYYKAVLTSPDSLLIGAYIRQKLVGFGVGTLIAKGYNMRLIKNNLCSFVWEAMKLFFRNPKSMIQLKNNFRKVDDQEDDSMYTELYSIAVEPSVSQKGIGSIIIKGFEQQAKDRGSKKVSLTTDSINNDKTLAFYRKNGYGLYYEFMAYPDRKMLRLIKQI